MKIGIITSGGDAPGMNACIRALVRYSISHGIEVAGFEAGWQGIIDNEYLPLNRSSVSNIIHRGGTILKTDRCSLWNEKEGRLKGWDNLRFRGIDALIVIGGDGSFRGALDLIKDTGFPVICIPASIDNDLGYTDFTIGFNTAVNTVVSAVNNIRDTMQSHNKVTFVEVMGRHCGDIALHSGIVSGAECILVPEAPVAIDDVANEITSNAVQGKVSNLVIMAEGVGRVEDLCSKFEQLTGIKPRQTRLGFIQRGGTPTYDDRLLATRCALKAMESLLRGESGLAVGIKGGEIFTMPLADALNTPKIFNRELYEASKYFI